MGSIILNVDYDALNQAQFDFVTARDPYVLMAGGVGSGKTTALALKLLTLKRENPHLPGLLIAPTYGTLWSVTLRALLGVLKKTMPPEIMPRIRDKQYECYLDFGDGVPVFLRSAQHPDSIDGLNVAWACGDEVRYWPRHSYDVAIARVRLRGRLQQVALASTPAIGWMSDEFANNKKSRRLITSRTSDNAVNLRDGFIEDLRQSYSPRVQRALVDGEFTVLEGSVYEQFDASKNSPWFVEYNPINNKQRKTFLAVDPGFRRSAWVWIHQINELEWIVFDQMMPENTSDSACVEMVNQRGWPIDEIWIDPAADNTQSAVGIDTLRVLAGIKTRSIRPIRAITDPWRSIEFGVDKLRVMLGGYEGLPRRLMFSNDLAIKERGKPRGIIKDLASYRYPECKNGRPITNLPLKDGVSDHGCDCARYWTVGMYLTNPALRMRDPELAKNNKPGWRTAA